MVTYSTDGSSASLFHVSRSERRPRSVLRLVKGFTALNALKDVHVK